jgi:hypothetical protein
MMADNKTAQWVSLLQQVQLAKNKRSHKALNGRFSRLFARNQIESVAEKFMDASEVPDTEISSIRTAAAADSVVGGQGHVHCDCLMKCQTKRCKCKKEGRLCNSRCHNQRDCCNK